jgi:hypothetical protein
LGSKIKTKSTYLGNKFISEHSETYTVIEYVSNDNITIQFEDGTTVKTRTVNVRKGNVPNPNRITMCGVGFNGVGEYPISENSKKTDSYVKWAGMLDRAYGLPNKSKAAYNDVIVDSTWFNFQTFAKWYYFNSRLICENEPLCLDKDLFGFKSKLYSEETCCIIPYGVNIAIKVGPSLYQRKDDGRWETKITRTRLDKATSRTVGSSLNKSEALLRYCEHKDKYVSDIADIYKSSILDSVYHELKNFNTKERLNLKGLYEILV